MKEPTIYRMHTITNMSKRFIVAFEIGQHVNALADFQKTRKPENQKTDS